jgi:2,3-bisphosphoglycerate-independent phosphoglycerate mutase
MKYVMVILDGATDRPLKDLELKTPLIAATGENLKTMARKARIGAVQPLPPDWSGDPEAALMSLFGFDPRGRFTGRGPLAAASLEIPMDRADVAFQVNLVHTDGEKLIHPTAGAFPKEAGRELARYVQETLRVRSMQLYPGAGPQHVLAWRDGPDGIECTSPHALVGEPLKSGFPRGDRAETLIGMMWDSMEVLEGHRINKARRDQGKPTADMIWPWSPGRVPELPGFGFRHGVGGACVAGSELVRGLARLARLNVLDVPGATGSLDTDYEMKAKAALTALREYPFCLVHIEAPNEAGLAGDWEAKTDALRRVDERFFGTLLDRIGLLDEFRILVVADHPTYVEERRAVPGWVPFMLTGSREKQQTRGILPFDESAVEDAEWRIDEGWRLLDQLFEGEPG